ncbi:DUF5801 repeats-in-toxin domain-containing protein [Marinomonas polaris]|uniref:DUF5801 repeats-in-toxin domain-containing protein n=1 Tax=Marinomonas polaris TaxID=293552 RepID=UPI001C318390|nr:DUF5801 repeats-in-toxin domain-containing protein [Marinomonas polaris]
MKADVTDTAGNPATDSEVATLDVVATAAPIVGIVDDENDDGLISKAELGNDGVQVSVTVDGKELEVGANSSVTLSITNNGVVSVVSLSLMANDDGSYKVISSDENDTRTYSYSNNTITWSETVAEGASIDVIATQTDNAGNVSDEGRDSAVVDNFTYTEADTANGIEDNVLSVNADNGVLSNDSDLDGGLTVASFTVNGVSYDVDAITPVAVVIKDGTGDDAKEVGSLTLRADGSYEFVPTANWSGDVPTVTYTTSTGESADLDINVVPVADAPKVELTITALESNDDSNAGDITQVNGGSGQPGGFDVQNGQIVKIGDGVNLWLTKGDPEPEVIGTGSIKYYTDGNPHGEAGKSDIFVVHPDSGWFYTQSDWNGREELRDLNSVLGGSVSQQSSDAMKDYIFLSGDTTGFDVSFGPNNRNSNFNTIDSIVVKYDNQTLISGSNQIEGVIYGNGTLGGPNQEDTTTETIATSQEFLIDVSAELTDRDGSETLSGITLTGIPDGVDVELVGAPDGVELSHNGSEWVISNPDGKDLTDIQLKMTVPQNSDAFTITAKATSTEGVGGDSAIGSATAMDTAPIITVDADVLAGLDVLTDDSYLRTADESVSTEVDFSSAFDVGYGTDGRGDVTYEIKLEDSSVVTGLIMTKTGEAISLSLDGGKLVGLTDSGVKVFEVTLDADGKVSMTQYEAVSHPDGTQDNEEITLEGLGVKLQVTATDADSNTSDADVATTEIDLGAHLKFADDGVSISQNAVPEDGYHVSTEGVTQVVTGSYSFAVTGAAWSASDSASSGHTLSQSDIANYQASGFTIKAIGLNGQEATVFETDYRGLSVQSHDVGSSVELPSEIAVRGGVSEQLIFKLEPGHLAFGINVQLSSLFTKGSQSDSEDEIAKVEFYRDGVLVGSSNNFVADASGGSLDLANLDSVPGGFDEVRFMAVDNGTGSGFSDNSDFAVRSISFIGADSAQPIASATGQVEANSADGIGDFKLTGLVDDLGYTVTLSDDGHTLKAVDEDNKPVFEIKMSGETGTWDVLQYQEMTQDIQFTVKAVDNDGDSATTVVSLGTERVNSAPELTFVDGSDSAVISEEGLADGNPDTVGDSDTTNNVTATGTFTVSDVDSDDTLTVSLVAPTEVIKSGGVTLVWTTDSSGDLVAKAGDTEIIRVALTDTDGQHGYVVTLSGPVDHADATSEDTASINFGIAVNDGSTTSTKEVTLTVEDDMPITATLGSVSADLTATVNTLAIGGLTVGWSNAQGGNNAINNALSGHDDVVSWGQDSAAQKSNYTFDDNNNLIGTTSVPVDTEFSLGTFTHNNFAINAGTSINSVNLDLSFDVVINGHHETINHTIKFNHKETPNDGTAEQNRDEITIDDASKKVEVEIGGAKYTFEITGFVDSEDKMVTANQVLYTKEGESNTFTLKAQIVSDNDAPDLTGKVDYDFGADGAAQTDAVVWNNGNNVITNSSGDTEVKGEFGVLIVKADGSYTYHLDQAAYNQLGDNDKKTEVFSYTLKDGDGDTSSSNLTINIKGELAEQRVNLLPEATDETVTLDIGSVSTNLVLTLDVSGSMVEGNVGNTGKTRFEIAQDSLISTIKSYQAMGETNINLTLFGASAKNIGWMSADSAIDYINKLVVTYPNYYVRHDGVDLDIDAGTDYLHAINGTTSIDFTGHGADQTVGYFITDGDPQTNQHSVNDSNDEAIINWKAFVDQNYNDLNVVGIGSNVSDKYLKPLQVEEGKSPLIVSNESGLQVTLVNTVQASVSGDVSDNVTHGNGATSYDSIKVGDITYTIDGSNGTTKFPSGGIALDGQGVLVFDFQTGKYTYTVGAEEFSDDTVKTFNVNASDEDGDSVSLTVAINVNPEQTFFEGVASSLMTETKKAIEDNAGGQDNDQVYKDYDFSDGRYFDTDNSGTIEGNSFNNTIYGNNGNDHILGDDGSDTLYGGNDNDWLEGGNGLDKLYGDSGNDLLDGGSGNDYLSGGAGNDILIGGAGDDSLLGGEGNDVLIGGAGNDQLTGGAGRDLFILDHDSKDTITDFNANDDALDLTDLLSGAEGKPGEDASEDAIASFLKDHVSKDSSSSLTVSDGSGHGATVNLDSASTADSIKVIYNDQEYNINIDG